MDPQVEFVRFWSKVTMNPFPRDHRTIVNNGEEKRPNGIVFTDWLPVNLVIGEQEDCSQDKLNLMSAVRQLYQDLCWCIWSNTRHTRSHNEKQSNLSSRSQILADVTRQHCYEELRYQEHLWQLNVFFFNFFSKRQFSGWQSPASFYLILSAAIWSVIFLFTLTKVGVI